MNALRGFCPAPTPALLTPAALRLVPLTSALLTSALLLGACATPPAADAPGAGGAFAQLTVEPARARAGGPVTITLTNRSDQQIGYNLCPATLDRQVGGDWQQHPESPAQACTMELRVLQPEASDAFRHTLPAGLPAGTYRFRVGVEWPLGGDRAGVASEAFQVER